MRKLKISDNKTWQTLCREMPDMAAESMARMENLIRALVEAVFEADLEIMENGGFLKEAEEWREKGLESYYAGRDNLISDAIAEVGMYE